MNDGRALGVQLPDVAALDWLQVVRISEAHELSLPNNLGRGEREVLTLAAQTPAALALLDDALARRYARQLNITFTGTLGILLRAKQTGHLSAIASVLDRLENLRFRLAPTTRAAVLRIAGE